MNLVEIFKEVLSLSFAGTVVALIIIVVKVALKNRFSASWHYYIWLLLILRLTIPFSIESSLSIFNLLSNSNFMQAELSQSNPEVEVVDQPDMTSNESNQVSQGISKNTVRSEVTNINEPMERVERGPDNIKESISTKEDKLNFNYRGASYIWFSGTITLASYFIMLYLLLNFRVRREARINDPSVIKILDDCRSKLGVTSEVSVISSSTSKSPSLFGFIKPRVLFPSNLTGKLSEEEIRYIFLHELAHLKRKDIVINWAMLMVLALHWFNPIVWYAYFKMQEDCEVACDALVLKHLEPGEHSVYGNAILDLIRLISRPRWNPIITSMTSKKSSINRRIEMISLFQRKSLKWTTLAISVFIIIGVVGLTNSKVSGGSTGRDVEDIEVLIEEKLNLIMGEGNPLSSNPYDYTKNSKDYQFIVKLGDKTLEPLITKLEESNKTDVDGLKEYIMAMACSEILGETEKDWSTGLEWYGLYQINRLVPKSLPDGMSLESKEVFANGVTLSYSNGATPGKVSKLLELSIQKPKPYSEAISLKTWLNLQSWNVEGQYKILEVDGTKAELFIHNADITTSIIMWLNSPSRYITIRSEGLTEEEAILATLSVLESDTSFTEDRALRVTQRNEILSKFHKIKNLKQLRRLLAPYQKNGWVIEERKTFGSGGEVEFIGASEKDHRIFLYVGNGELQLQVLDTRRTNIAGIHLGDSREQVEKILGKPHSEEYDSNGAYTGENYFILSYYGIEVHIGESTKKVIRIQTDAREYHTSLGFSVGSGAEHLLKTYRAKYNEHKGHYTNEKVEGVFEVEDGQILSFDFNKADGALVNKNISPEDSVEQIILLYRNHIDG